MLFVGWLNSRLPKTTKAVLVGGSLVQFYSGGAYESVDIDLVVDSRGPVTRILDEAGFKKDVRGFEDDELDLIIDLSAKGLRPTESVVEVEFEGLIVPMVSLEDSIIDRLRGAKFWRSDQDWEQAVLLFRANAERVDGAVLRKKAKANDVEDFADLLAGA